MSVLNGSQTIEPPEALPQNKKTTYTLQQVFSLDFVCVCVCVCVRARVCVRMCVCECVRVCEMHYLQIVLRSIDIYSKLYAMF